MNPNIKINIEDILDNDVAAPEYLDELSKKFFRLANAMKSEDNEDDSESSESSGNNSGNNSENSESSGNNSVNNINYDKKN